MPYPRRFPSPWSIEQGSAYFIVRDHDKQALAYVHYETESGRRSSAKLSRGTASSGTQASTSWDKVVEELKRKEKVDGRKKRE